MKQRLIGALVALVALSLAATAAAVQVSAQQSTQTPPPIFTPTPSPDWEKRIYQLEVEQEKNIGSLKSINEQNRFIITGVGAIIAVLVAIQGFATASHLRREQTSFEKVSGIMDAVQQTLQRRLEEEQNRKIDQVSNIMDVVERTLESRLEVEEQAHEASRAGVEQVSKIMEVVQRTLESRLDAEKQAREEARQAQVQLQTVLDRFTSLERFYKNFQMTIKNARRAIEESASRLAQVPRHGFKERVNELSSFAQQFDTFKAEFEDLEEEPHPKFSARVLYIRGIAALYANQPEDAKQYLEKVIHFQDPEPGEPHLAFDRRVAVAYYYLGLIESNFGNHQGAIDSLEAANKRDLERRDFLTRIVTAEAYVMINNFDSARRFLSEVEEELGKMERAEGRLYNHQLRLRSRAALIRANMAILGRQADEARKLLEPVYAADPRYYYATATLAQVYASQGDFGGAERLFREAYETVERSGHLFTVVEARSKILLLMVAGMCCKHGIRDERRSEEYLDQADGLRGSLPTLGGKACTVFSTLSKRSESSGTVHEHIEKIREDVILLGLDK
jgi:tetratricopeptide (TPR) repeat protein